MEIGAANFSKSRRGLRLLETALTLRKQTLGSILLTTVVLVVVLYFASRSIILKGFSELESHHVRGNTEQVMDYISHETVSLEATLARWTAGKEPSDIIRDAERRLPSTETADTLAALRLNVLMLVKTDGEVLFAKVSDLSNEQQAQVTLTMKGLFSAGTRPHRQITRTGPMSGLVLVPDGPMIVSARPLLEKREREPFRGVALAGRFLDVGAIESLGRGMKLTIIGIDEQDTHSADVTNQWCDGLSQDSPVCTKVTGPEQVSGYALLSDIHGKPAMILRIDAPRQIYDRGRGTVNYFLLSLVGAGLIFAAVTIFVLDRRIVSRLRDLSLGVSDIAAGGDLSRRVDERGTDELATLSREINMMLDALHHSEAALRAAHDELEERVQERTAELRREINQRMLVEEELRRSEERLRASLVEKEVLLGEIHHRVKNNLQVMASLLNLQSGYVKDENLLQVFKDAESRIWSMALVHETLYRSGNLALIKAKEYVENLVDELCTSYGRDSAKIGLKVDIEDHCFALDTAVTLGLIINELVSNALKHAFPRLDEYGEISVRLVAVDHNEFELTVGDNGVGMVPDTQVNGEKSFGLHLVKALVRQLDGEVNVRAERGTTFVIRFKEADKCTTP